MTSVSEMWMCHCHEEEDVCSRHLCMSESDEHELHCCHTFHMMTPAWHGAQHVSTKPSLQNIIPMETARKCWCH